VCDICGNDCKEQSVDTEMDGLSENSSSDNRAVQRSVLGVKTLQVHLMADS
jgi:hypothetical protein